MVLSCSDSRVPPELVFDQGLGDIYVVRQRPLHPPAFRLAIAGRACLVCEAHLRQGFARTQFESVSSGRGPWALVSGPCHACVDRARPAPALASERCCAI